MNRNATGWRRLGGLLVACVLAVLTFGPSFDMLICHDEAGISAPLVDATPAIQGDTHGAGHAESPLGICQHGHCHHAVHYLSNAEAVAALDPEPAYRPLPAPAAFPAFDLAYGLKRPPRA